MYPKNKAGYSKYSILVFTQQYEYEFEFYNRLVPAVINIYDINYWKLHVRLFVLILNILNIIYLNVL